MKKKLIGFLLCLVAVLGISTAVAFADVISGEGYTYNTESKVLTITSDIGLTSWSSTVTATEVTSIVIGKDVTTSFGYATNLNYFTNATELTFEGTSTLGGSFSVVSSIKKITFEGATTIKEGAFSGSNTTLETITFAANPQIQNSAFQNYTGLTSVTFNGDVTLGVNETSPFQNCTALTSVKFEGASILSGYAFNNCPNIETITFGGQTILNGSAFGGSNTKLKMLTFPVGSEINSAQFKNYTALDSVTFDGNISLGNSAFYNCNSLKSVTFKGTSTLSGAAFQGSGASLKSLSFGGATTITSTSVFACGGTNTNTELTKLVFPAGSKLPQAAFQSYTGLKTVTFEGSVTLGTYIFPACSQLNDFYFNSTDASSISLDNETFKQLAVTINIYVPEIAVEAYKSTLTATGTTSAKYANCVKTNAEHATHNWSNGACSICNIACKHADPADAISDWITDSNQHWKVYATCGAKSDLGNHSWSKGVCSTCSLACTHNWSEGACSICSLACSHSWSNGVCSICRLVCTHVDEAKQWAYNETQHWEVYSTCGAKTDPANHEYGTDNKCTTCGYTKPVATYSGGSGSSTQRPTVTTPENGKVTLSSNGRTATITPEEGYQVASVTVNGVDKGKVTELTGLKTGDEIAVTFEKTKETLDKEASEAVGALSSMKARSSKTSKGNVKVVMNLSTAEKSKIEDLKAEGYTVKYRFYRSTKKSSGYKATKTGATGTYYNTIGKVGKMYYYKARVLVYDQDGKLVASTKLSDCKYANRTWTKK